MKRLILIVLAAAAFGAEPEAFDRELDRIAAMTDGAEALRGISAARATT